MTARGIVRAALSCGMLIAVPPATIVAATESWMTRTDSGGMATTNVLSRGAFTQHAPELPVEGLPPFARGNRIFGTSWIQAPASVESFDGLGPYYNERSCSSCHGRDGRGRPSEPGDAATGSMVVKLARVDEGGVAVPDPTYGTQLSDRAIQGVEPEGRLVVRWLDAESGTRRPEFEIVELAMGPLDSKTFVSPRIAPGAYGTGLLELIPESTLVAREDPDDANRDGISGRVHWITDSETGTRTAGRFGWKSTQPTVAAQVAAALAGDLGITSRVQPREELTRSESRARELPTGGSPEIDAEAFDALVGYCRMLAVPARRDADDPQVLAGARLFVEVRCANCHIPESTTGVGAGDVLSNQPILPFTDLLLHDLGAGLSDGMPEGDAASSEWRTAPLWGIGLANRVNGFRFLLHDGRARNLEEAVRWHGGEAESSRAAYIKLSAADRAALHSFLESL